MNELSRMGRDVRACEYGCSTKGTFYTGGLYSAGGRRPYLWSHLVSFQLPSGATQCLLDRLLYQVAMTI